MISLWRENRAVAFSVHRLVAAAWVDRPKGATQVNHRNGDKTDNRADNLEWVTPSQNQQHMYRVLGRTNPMQGRTGAMHPRAMPVEACNTTTGERRRYDCAASATADGFDFSAVLKCAKGQRPAHKGFTWRFCGS